MTAASAKALPVVCCTPFTVTMDPSEAEATSTVFRSLADPHRVRLLNLLATSESPVCVCDLTDELGLSQSTVSFHLKKLLQAGLIRRERHGTWAYYSVEKDALTRLRRVFEAAS